MWSDGSDANFISVLWGRGQPSGGNTYNCAFTDKGRTYMMNDGCDSDYYFMCKRQSLTPAQKQYEEFQRKAGPNGDFGIKCRNNCLMKDMKHRK